MRRQRGVALIMAVFVLVVLAALAGYMLNLSGTQHFTTMWAVQGARAHYAAKAGVEWGAYQALNGGSCNGSLSVDAGATNPFPVTVSCSSSSFDELGVSHTLWQIDAVATSGGSLGDPGYVRRAQRTTVVGP